jgi:enamine deaminase RidA (YjgF/YER057c/UK114 family)
MNAASDLLVKYFGEAGKHVRSAVGVASLPRNASVEVELTVEIE